MSANFVSPELMYSEMLKHEMKYFRVMPGISVDARGNAHALVTNWTDAGEWSVDDARIELENALAHCEGNVTVNLSNRNDVNNGGKTKSGRYHIRCKPGLTSLSQVNPPSQHSGIYGPGFGDYISKLDEISSLRNQLFKAEFERDQAIKELKEGGDGIGGHGMRLLEKILENPQIMGGPQPGAQPHFEAPQAMAGANMPSPEEAHILNECALFLYQNDPDFVNNFKLLARLREKMPEMYNEALSKLKMLA